MQVGRGMVLGVGGEGGLIRARGGGGAGCKQAHREQLTPVHLAITVLVELSDPLLVRVRVRVRVRSWELGVRG